GRVSRLSGLSPAVRADPGAVPWTPRRLGAGARDAGRAGAGDHRGARRRMTSGRHWPEYAMEGGLLALFMMAACTFAAVLEPPGSPLRQALPHPVLRRVLMGLAIGTTAITLVRSPWGQQSGAHMNPSLTFTYWRLGKVRGADALGYVLSQFLGSATGIV